MNLAINGRNITACVLLAVGAAVSLLEHRREQPVGLFCLDGRPHLKRVAVPTPDLTAYSSLTSGVAS